MVLFDEYEHDEPLEQLLAKVVCLQNCQLEREGLATQVELVEVEQAHH
jgi:hypothetical protein